LLLIPSGIMRQRKRAGEAGKDGEAPPLLPIIDLNQETTRKSVIIFLVLTLVNILVLAGATYKGVEIMDSNAFCGLACHSVMQPEWTAHQRSPHSRVRCVDCHIGPGADWFVKSKLDGAWQMVAVTLNIYPRPIQTPLHDLRPARDTCEQCHWPYVFVGRQAEDRDDLRGGRGQHRAAQRHPVEGRRPARPRILRHPLARRSEHPDPLPLRRKPDEHLRRRADRRGRQRQDVAGGRDSAEDARNGA
jgi:hypothetical protein